MLIEQTLNKMNCMKLFEMAGKLREMTQSGGWNSISNEDFISYLIDSEYIARENRKRTRLLRQAGLKYQSRIEEIDYHSNRGLHKSLILELMNNRWTKNRQNILLSGPTGIGKSFIACALGYNCCDQGIKTRYLRTNRFLEEVRRARGLGTFLEYYQKLSKFDVLILDDFGMSILNKKESSDFLDLIEDRYLTGSIIITSQVPIENWYGIFTDETIADAICDRIFHNAYKLQLQGESMRKTNKKETI